MRKVFKETSTISPFASSSSSLMDSLEQLNYKSDTDQQNVAVRSAPSSSTSTLSRYENQKRRDWNTFGHYISNHRPPLPLARCSGAHVVEFLRYLDQFGKTKIHSHLCPFFGHPSPSGPCTCPLRQAWGSLDALVGRLRAAYEEHGGKADTNPFAARAVRLYLCEVRELQAKARGISYEKKKRKRQLGPLPPPPPPPHAQMCGPTTGTGSSASVISQLKL